ncbi:hypothetical protein ACQKGD_10825 [Peribacillus frigoritolerans]|uniref:hypothetical protein n=1 Tax=Peribacillus frigoritolerans TaxID=450367 RepID=UPI003D08EE4F
MDELEQAQYDFLKPTKENMNFEDIPEGVKNETSNSIKEITQLEEANIYLGKENSRLLLLVNDKSEEIKQLKAAATDLEEEIHDLKKIVDRYETKMIEWTDNALLHAREKEEMTNQYKDLKNTLESISKENKLTKALLKEVL